jgi:hypothetical protein
MDCPNCQLVNPPGALKCDCGYDFATGHNKSPLRGNQQSRSSRLWWIILLLIPMPVGLLPWYVGVGLIFLILAMLLWAFWLEEKRKKVDRNPNAQEPPSRRSGVP